MIERIKTLEEHILLLRADNVATISAYQAHETKDAKRFADINRRLLYGFTAMLLSIVFIIALRINDWHQQICALQP